METKSRKAICSGERDYLKIALYATFVLSSIIAVVWMCALQGGNIFDIFLPNSQWNDEVFYYKQVEGMIWYGMPQGYFGYNEVLPNHLTFGAWGPVMLIPYFLFGKVFGWGMSSPIICNLMMVTLAYLAFVILAKPDKKQTIFLIVLIQVFTVYNRYIISGMVEAVNYAGIIFLAGVLCFLYKNPNSHKGIWIYMAAAAILTLMRPYYLVFFAFALYTLFSQKRWGALCACVAILVATLAAYFWISNNLCAPYFSPIINMDFLAVLKERGVFACAGFIFSKTFKGLGNILSYIILDSGKTHGAVYAALFVTIVSLIGLFVFGIRKKDNKSALFFGFALGVNFLVLLAIVLLYSTYVGSRHMIPFLLMNSIFVLLYASSRIKIVNIACVCIVFVLIASEPYVYQIPFATEEAKQSELTYTQAFDEKFSISKGSKWDNTVAFVLFDSNEETGELMAGRWQILYYLPPGFGINLVGQDFDVATTNSKYICVIPNGEIYAELSQSNAVEVMREGGFIIYQMY